METIVVALVLVIGALTLAAVAWLTRDQRAVERQTVPPVSLKSRAERMADEDRRTRYGSPSRSSASFSRYDDAAYSPAVYGSNYGSGSSSHGHSSSHDCGSSSYSDSSSSCSSDGGGGGGGD